MSPEAKSTALGTGMVLLGVAALLLACLMVLPVAVNLPASWFGAVLAIAIAVGGIALLYRGFRRLSAKPQ